MPPKATKTPRKAANGFKLPDPLPEGLVFQSSVKQSWKMGKSIGVGGFGEIYLCSENIERAVGEDAPLAVKIEPHENGPLFVEMNFYMRAAMPEVVEEFKRQRKIPNLGMPVLRGHGSHTHKGERYRFLVMDRFGNDLQKIFQNGKKLFSDRTAYNLAVKIIDVLEYIHSKGYVHNDIKAQNLLLGYGRTKENDVFLVDFGLVCKYQRDGVHLEYKPDARFAHDGTIEYTSRDAHIGAHSRRSDMEILGYNLLHWMSGNLPWMDSLTNPQTVHNQKKTYMNDIPNLLHSCFGDNEHPEEVEEFLTYVTSLDFDTEPDYDHCRDIFKSGLRKRKYPLDGKIDFSAPKSAPKKVRKGRKLKKPSREAVKNGILRPTPATSPSLQDFGTDSGAVTRSGENEEMEGWCWESVLCSDPEMLIRQASRQSENEDESPLALQHRELEARRQAESLKNPTAAMIEIIKRMEERERERQQMTWQQQLQHLTGRKVPRNNSCTFDLTPNPLTPAMEEVIQMRSRKISIDYDVPITPDPSDSDPDTSDSDSSHEEYVPSSCKKQKLAKEPPHQSNGAVRLASRRASPVRKGPPDEEIVEVHSNGGITFEAEEDDEDEFENVMLNESILKFLREDGVTLAQQQQELRRYNKSKKKNHASNVMASSSTSGHLHVFPSERSRQDQLSVLEESEFFSTPTKGNKARRISIQNDVSPIRNKESPPELQLPQFGDIQVRNGGHHKSKSKGGERWIVPSGHVKHPNIDEAEEGEVKKSSSKRKARPAKRSASRGKSKKPRTTRSQRSSPEPAAVVAPAAATQLTPQRRKRRRQSATAHHDDDVEAQEQPQTAAGKKAVVTNSSLSAAMVHVAKMKSLRKPLHQQQKRRRVRSRCDTQWNWGEVLLTNPEHILRRK